MQASRLVTPVAVGVGCGIGAGAVAGLWARLAMRLVALGVADPVGVAPQFTVAGTLAIVVGGAVVGGAAGLVYGLLAGRLPGPARWRGLVYGALLLVLVGPFFFRIEEFFSTGRVLLFVPPFVLYGFVLSIALVPLSRIVGRMPFRAQAALAAVGLGAACLILFVIAASIFRPVGDLAM